MKSSHLSYAAGIGTLLVGAGARLALGAVRSGLEAVMLIGALADSGLYLGSAVVTAAAMMLALMLTILGLTRKVDDDFSDSVFRDIHRVSVLATCSLLAGIVLLLALTLPIDELDGVPSSYYVILYDVLFVLILVASALLVTTVVQLFETIREIIRSITPLDDL